MSEYDASLEPPEPEAEGREAAAEPGETPAPPPLSDPHPVEEAVEEEEPPEARWQVFPNQFGPGVDRVLFDGEPLGVVLDRDHYAADSRQVTELLVALGAPAGVPATFARRRKL